MWAIFHIFRRIWGDIFHKIPACGRIFYVPAMQYSAHRCIYLNEKKVKNGHVFYLFVFLHFLT